MLSPSTISRNEVLPLLLVLVTVISCEGRTRDIAGEYTARVAYMSYSSDLGRGSCARPTGVVSGEVPLVVVREDSSYFVDFHFCRIAGVIKEGKFVASEAPCGSTGERWQFPARTYDHFEVDFTTGEMEALYSDFGSFGPGEGQCSQLEGHVRRDEEGWSIPSDDFLKVTGELETSATNYKGEARLDSYMHRGRDGELYLLGLSCTFRPIGGPGGTVGMGGAPGPEYESTCEEKFGGKHGVPSFTPNFFSHGDSTLQLSGQFSATPETIALSVMDAEVEPDEP